MHIIVEDHQSDVTINPDDIKQLVREILLFKKIFTNEVSLHFVNESTIKKLHSKYFNDPSLTDCITFPIDAPSDIEQEGVYHILGEAFICPKAALQFVGNKQELLPEELTLYVIHCVLHLLGFDDQSEKDRRQMRKEENICLNHIKNQSFFPLAKKLFKTNKLCYMLLFFSQYILEGICS